MMNIEDYTFKIDSPAAMEALGAACSAVLDVGDLLLLHGCLGAGKTTLVRGLARQAGYQGKVTSPSFTLMNIYPVQPPLYHFDFYRLESMEIEDLGLDDYIGREGIALVEWPDAAAGWLPEEWLGVTITLCDEDYNRERQVVISAAGAASERKRERLMQIVALGH